MDKRVAIVTGASKGIGKSISLSLAAAGKHVVLVARSADKLEELKTEIEASGGSAEARACDMTDSDAVNAMIEAVADEHKRLDILVNNAGITRDNLLLRMTDEEFDDVIHMNLRSVFIACRAALRPMMRGKFGRVINIASIAGIMGNPGQANYAAAKAGLVGMTKTLAKEMAPKKITANIIAPGFIETDMTADLPDAVKKMACDHTPLRRMGQPEEIAAAVAFLASDEASYITGQTLAIDGGMTMH